MKTKLNIANSLVIDDQSMNETNVNELYTEYKKKDYCLALSYVKDNYVAEDLTHEILIKCYLARKKFNGNCSFYSWMYRIATNHCIDYLRKVYRRPDFPDEHIEFFTDKEVCTPESELLNRSDQEELLNKLRLLPSKYQEVLTLYYFKNQTLKEIEHHLNINLSTIKSRMFRAKRLLREMY